MAYPPQPPYGDGNPYPATPGYGVPPGYGYGYGNEPAYGPIPSSPGFQPHGQPPTGYPGPQPYGQPGYPAYGPVGAPDPMAPFGRDPLTGEALSDKSKVAAGLLQLFLGGFGVGRFYLGYTGIGVAQLCLTIVGWLLLLFVIGIIPLVAVGIWALVDAIMIFTDSVRDSRGFKLRP